MGTLNFQIHLKNLICKISNRHEISKSSRVNPMYSPPSFSSYQYSANLGNPTYALLLHKNIVSKLKPISKSHLIGGLIISKFERGLSKAVLCCLILSCNSWHQAF